MKLKFRLPCIMLIQTYRGKVTTCASTNALTGSSGTWHNPAAFLALLRSCCNYLIFIDEAPFLIAVVSSLSAAMTLITFWKLFSLYLPLLSVTDSITS